MSEHKLFEYFYDGKIRIGEEWDEVIIGRIQSADAVLFLLSNEYLINPYCRKEIAVAKEAYRKSDQFGIYSIVLEHCAWPEFLGEFQAFPRKTEMPLLYYKENEQEQEQDKKLLNYIREVVREFRKL